MATTKCGMVINVVVIVNAVNGGVNVVVGGALVKTI